MSQLIKQFVNAKQRGCRRRVLGCLALIGLCLLGCGLFFWLVQTSHAAPLRQEDDPLAIYLLIDNSQSMFEKDGIGSDPDQLRIDAARLFTTYLGTEDGRFTHQCGVIFFGTDAQHIVPLTRLNSDTRRRQLYDIIQNPPQMGWTNHLAALEMAYDQFQQRGDANGRFAIVLLTDGKPELGPNTTSAEQNAYLAQLRTMRQKLAQAKIPLFIILLANQTTDADSEISTLWQPLWQDMAQATHPGRYYEARQAQDLFTIYHDIVVTLTNNSTTGTIIDSQIGATGLRQTVAVEPNLDRLTFVISKSSPDITVTIQPPPNSTPELQKAGTATEEVWTIDTPPSGNWTILASGSGKLIVWKDYRALLATTAPVPTASPQPTATALPTATPTPTATIIPTATATLRPTATPRPRLPMQEPDAPANAATPKPFWPWLLTVALGSLITAVFLHRSRHRPHLTGSIRILSGAPVAYFELEPYRKATLTLGLPPADIPLAAALEQLTLTVGATADDILLSTPMALTINGRSLPNTIQLPHTLHDNDLITFGDLTLRYENLRLRRTQFPPAPSRRSPLSPTRPTPLPRFSNPPNRFGN